MAEIEAQKGTGPRGLGPLLHQLIGDDHAILLSGMAATPSAQARAVAFSSVRTVSGASKRLCKSLEGRAFHALRSREDRGHGGDCGVAMEEVLPIVLFIVADVDNHRRSANLGSIGEPSSNRISNGPKMTLEPEIWLTSWSAGCRPVMDLSQPSILYILREANSITPTD